MGNYRYVKGRRFEHQVRKWYESKGYTVIRSAGSKGKIDLIIWGRELIRRVNPLAVNVPRDKNRMALEAHSYTTQKVEDVVKVIQCKIYDAKATKPLRTDVELLRQVEVPSGWQRVLAWKVNGSAGWKEEIV